MARKPHKNKKIRCARTHRYFDKKKYDKVLEVNFDYFIFAFVILKTIFLP